LNRFITITNMKKGRARSIINEHNDSIDLDELLEVRYAIIGRLIRTSGKMSMRLSSSHSRLSLT
jgi:hypothetical protein